MTKQNKIVVENINVSGHTSQVDAVKYQAMRDLILKITPKIPPGLTAKEMLEELQPLLPQELWPNGAKSGWWQKTVQLDLEAKGLLMRNSSSTPLRWHRAA